jgi:O-antigen ligase
MTALGVLLAAVLGVVFWRLERRDRGIAVVAIIWSLLLLEVTLYPNQTTVPPGIFHPAVGGLTFRLIDLVVPIAVAARIGAHGLGRFGGNALLWGAFFAWLLTAGFIGVLNGNSLGIAAFEAKALLYLSAILLTATIPAREYLASRMITRLIGGAAVLAALLLFTSTAGLTVDLGARPPEDAAEFVTEGEEFGQTGELSTDAATMFVALGVIALALAVNSPVPRQRAGLMIAAAPLLASTIGSAQRAAFLELGVAMALLVLMIMVSSRPLRTTATEIGLAVMIVAALVLAPLVVSTARGAETGTAPFEREIAASVSGPVEQQTTEGRLYQWRAATGLIEERPLFGWGLGLEYEYFDPGFAEFFTVDITHNIVFDLLLRTGVVGLLLFLAAMGTSAYRGLRAWFRERDGLLAALAMGTVAALGGVLAKGLAESLFEKYRVAVALALLIGILISVASAFEAESGGPREGVRAAD